MTLSPAGNTQHNPPIGEYFAYLCDAIKVERKGRTWQITFPIASLQSLLAQQSPATTIYAAERAGIWELSDLGQNLKLLHDVGFDPAKLLSEGVIQGMLAKMAVEVSDDGALAVRTSPQLGFGEALHHMLRAVQAFTVEFFHLLSFETGELSDVFDLEGEKIMLSGAGSNGDSGEETEEFDLLQGSLAVYAEHSGTGEFSVYLEQVDGGFFGSVEELVKGVGQGGWVEVLRVSDGWFELKPGRYRLNVSATDEWRCGLIQPHLGQSPVEMPYRSGGAEGGMVAGPFRVGSRPLLASVRHDGGGPFVVRLISLDGTDQTDVIEENGQVHLEEHPTDALPGKEYLLFVLAGGTWELEFTEGY